MYYFVLTGKVVGPCFFGGWSECCCDFEFSTSYFESRTKGDIASITKKKPQGIAGGAAELFSEADNYSIRYNLATQLTAAQKTSVIAAQILIDYMLFDGNTQKCDYRDGSVYCYFCYCSIVGCLVPCYIQIPLNQSG